MQDALKKLKQAWDENPVAVVAVGAAAVTSLSKLIDAVSGIQGRRAYAKNARIRAQNGR